MNIIWKKESCIKNKLYKLDPNTKEREKVQEMVVQAAHVTYMHTLVRELYPLIPYHIVTTMLSMFYVLR